MNFIVKTRPVQADDEPFLKSLFATTEYERLPLAKLEPSLVKKILRTEFNGHHQYFDQVDCEKSDALLLVNGQPVGRLIVLQNQDEIRLADLALMPEVRNRGLGTALIESLQVQARLSNRPLRLTVMKDSRARNFYRRMGFYKCDETETHLLLEWKYGTTRTAS